jgi:predicted RNA-binding protein with PUA-like domain
MAKKYWLMKVEPDSYTIDDLERDKTTNWEGVRNFKARNYMRDEMQVGDEVLFYASNADPSGVTGLAKIVRAGYPEKNPMWSQVDIGFVKNFGGTVSLETLKHTKGLESMGVIRRGNRLSIQPVTKAEFDIVVGLGTRLSKR